MAPRPPPVVSGLSFALDSNGLRAEVNSLPRIERGVQGGAAQHPRAGAMDCE